jgi:hypothetical protein
MLNMRINEVLMNKMCELAKEVAVEAIMGCGELYNFSFEEAIRRLNLNAMPVSVVSSSKKKDVVLKAQFPLPYNGECDGNKCQALRHNGGLYTQCGSSKKEGQEYCGACEVSAEKNGGTPEYGTIQQRQAVGIMEYVDPKGRKPVAYTKIMKKQKVSQEQVLEEAGKFNIEINPIHFEEPEADAKRGRPKTAKEAKEPKGAKGRPKKDAKVVHIEGEEEDLFAALVAANVPAVEEESAEEVVLKSNKKSEEERNAEKAAKKAADDATKALKKQQDEEAKAAKKAADEAEKVAKKAAEEAAKAAKKAAEEEAKIAKKAAEEEAKAAKALKKQQEEEAKIAKKAAEEEAKALKKQQQEEAKAAKAAKPATKPAAKVEAKVEAKPAAKVEAKVEAKMEVEAEEEEPDVVKKIDFEGKKYLKSKKTGIIYDYNEYITNQEQVVVGKWNANTNKIDFQAAAESEEEEEDGVSSDSDSEEEAEEYDE